MPRAHIVLIIKVTAACNQRLHSGYMAYWSQKKGEKRWKDWGGEGGISHMHAGWILITKCTHSNT